MNERKASVWKVLRFALVSALLLAGCAPRPRVGALKTESQWVDLGAAGPVRVEIEFGAGDLKVTGGAEKLLEADFSYNVARLKPEVTYEGGRLSIQQPEAKGLPVLRDLSGFRNEWDLRLNEETPVDLSVDMGGGKSDLQLAGLSLNSLDVSLGAGESTIDLSGSWAKDLDVAIDSGAGDITVLLPGDVGVRVEIDAGASSVDAEGFSKDGNVYTNAAYGESDVTLRVSVEAGIGRITLEAAGKPAAQDYSSITAELSQLIKAAVDEAGITGMSVALVDDQEIVWSQGFGYADKEKQIEATPQTVYGVGSISKLFTASAIMQLAERGEIDIDQPLQTYVPEFSVQSRFPDAAAITPRNLMTHHSGMPSDWANGLFAFGEDRDDLTREEFSKLVQDLQQAHTANPPDAKFSYSNLGYALLGHAVEGVTGREFIDYMDEAIFKPLGMDSSSFTVRSAMRANMSKEYMGGAEQEVIWSRDIPAATLRSTVEDLSRFMMMVFGDGETGGERILRADTLKEMMSAQNSDVPLDFDARWGLGWWLIPYIDYAGVNAWHTGGEGMWNSMLLTLPEHKLGVVVLSNSAEASDVNDDIATAVLERALKVKTGLERPAEQPPQVVSLPAGELPSYAGTYSTDLGWMTIRADGADLVADALGQSFKLLPLGGGRFAIEGVSPRDALLTIQEVNGRTALSILGYAFGLVYGERLEPAPISDAWMSRLGAYETTNEKRGFLDFLTGVQLKEENGFLVLDAARSDTGEQFSFPLGTLSDDEAVILGLGLRGRGDTIRIVEVDGGEQLFYSGYTMKKVEGAAEQPAPGKDVYADPQGRYTFPMIGEWTQIETDGSYALFAVPGQDFQMSVHTNDSTDLAASEVAAIHQAGYDPTALTLDKEYALGDWKVLFYSRGGSKGLTSLCQVVDAVTYCLIAAGDVSLTTNPPEQVFKAIEGFKITGKQTVLPGTVEEFEAYVNSFLGENPPGLSVVITLGGEVIYAKGFGTADGPKGMAAAPDTVFMWGSMTKIVTAVAVMQLVDRGLVDLDAPLSDYLDYFPAEYGITVRQLLDHSAGLAEPFGFVDVNLSLDGQPLADTDRIAREYVQELTDLMFEPGSQSTYSNPGFTLLGQVVAEVSGHTYVEFVRENILSPLGMKNTDFTYSSQAMLDLAAAPSMPAAIVQDFITAIDQVRGPVAGADLIREVGDQHAWMNRFSVISPIGGLIGPADEAIRFAQMHLNGGELDGVRILSPESVALMQVVQHAPNGDPLGYGVGWRVIDDVEHPFVEHDGGGDGLWAKTRLYPKVGLGIVLMSNAQGWNRDKLADAAANVVFTMTGQ